MKGMTQTLIGGLVAAGLSCPAAADNEKIIATVAPDAIAITSSYSGRNVVIFGVIEATGATRPYDVVVTVLGPRETVTAQRKVKVAGIWVNGDSRTFPDLPSYLTVVSNRPLEDIAAADIRRKNGVGIANALMAERGELAGPDRDYLDNIIKIRNDADTFSQTSTVTFLSPRMFRADIYLPGTVLVGSYDVDIKLFSSGAQIAERAWSIDMTKVGVSEFVIKTATNDGLAYGLATMAMALLTGWIASVAFRRD